MDGAERPDYVAPFLIDRKQALKTFEGWIRQKKFVLKTFYDAEQIEKFSGVYFPYRGERTGRETRRAKRIGGTETKREWPARGRSCIFLF